MRAAAVRAGLVLALLTPAGCGAGAAEPAAAPTATGAAALPAELTVFAAASLTDAFEVIADDFEAANPGVDVTFNFAGSQQLATQILEGAPADVFAAADAGQMERIARAELAVSPEAFAGNRLAVSVEPGNPRAVTGLGDLARDDLRVVLAAEEVPAGRYARQALDAANVDVEPVSLETDVRAVLMKVALGEADAGIVYASDVVAAGDEVEEVAVPVEDNVVATYPIAVLTTASNPDAAAAFVRFVGQDVAQTVLGDFGFSRP